MTPAHQHILAILRSTDVPSRTMLQKLVFFLARARGDALGFRAHYFGPYSADVQAAIGDLVRANLISEAREGLSPWAGSDPEPVQFRYALTELGLAALLDPQLLTASREVVEAVQRQHAFTASALAYAAKLAHIADIGDQAVTIDQVPELAWTLGWHLTPDDSERAARLLTEIETTVARGSSSGPAV